MIVFVYDDMKAVIKYDSFGFWHNLSRMNT